MFDIDLYRIRLQRSMEEDDDEREPGRVSAGQNGTSGDRVLQGTDTLQVDRGDVVDSRHRCIPRRTDHGRLGLHLHTKSAKVWWSFSYKPPSIDLCRRGMLPT